MPEYKSANVSWKRVEAFRLSRHHLSKRAPLSALTSVAGNIAGAQAQVLSAAQLSIWARIKGAILRDLDSAIWEDHSLVKAWCMRGTLFLLPSDELAVFARGSNRKPSYEFRWAVSRVGSEEILDKLLGSVLEVMKQPSTRTDIAERLSKSYGYKLRSKAGGGWGNRTAVPWVEVGKASLPVGYLFHLIGARAVICSGPSRGNESTYVRADKWVSHWKDMPVEKAEIELLEKYLKAFGPSTVTDFALWLGIYVRDAKEIWSRVAEDLVQVDVEGWKASILETDLEELESAEAEEPNVRLLPNFDSFLLGHKSHRNLVDEKNHRKVYRPQGWVSPVLLVNGRARGVWSQERKGSSLEVRVTPFSKLSPGTTADLKTEAAELGRFLECSTVKTVIG